MKKELSERQRLILSLVVHEFIKSAVPVGSKTLVDIYNLEFSPATVRNEMAALTELDYLQQPYTSAGRVPTEKGYRFFVSGLMRVQQLPEETRRMIEHQFSQAQEGIDGWMKLAASILANQVNAVSLVSAPLPSHTYLKHLALVSITGKQVLMIMVMGGGQMQQRFLYVNELTDQEKLTMIQNHINNRLVRKTSEQIREECKSFSMDGNSVEEEIMRNVVTAMYETDAMQAGEVYIDGLSNVLSEPEFTESEEARRALRLLEEKPVLQKFLSKTSKEQKVGGVQVLIGGEGILANLRNCSMVLARYGDPNILTGSIGILGPMRMSYSKNIPTVRFLAGILSDLVSDSSSMIS